MTPDGCWDIIIAKNQGQQTVMLVNRPLMQSARVPHTAGLEMLTITFATGAFVDLCLPQSPTGMLFLPLAGKNKFWLGSKVVEIPTFENADILGSDLHRKNILVSNTIITGALANKATAQERTQQRHFKRITGMTFAYFKQVERAQAAAHQLRHGAPILQVAHDQGYSDQFHLAKSLQHILGQTPTQIRHLGT